MIIIRKYLKHTSILVICNPFISVRLCRAMRTGAVYYNALNHFFLLSWEALIMRDPVSEAIPVLATFE